MIGATEVSLVVLIIAIATDGLLNFVFFISGFRGSAPGGDSKGAISVLIATRNEEGNILECLDSLLNQNYQSEKIEILLGDDSSSDDTVPLATRIARQNSNLAVYQIDERLGNAQGKGNVIAHLTKKAKFEQFCITDADMIHSKDWASSVSAELNSETGICIGVTAVAGQGLGARLQNLDWLLAQGMIIVATRLGLPVTALGNNMAITREAYDSTGGLEALPPTITEDFQLFRFIQKKGYKLVVNMSQAALCFTQPMTNLSEWLQQRKRWAFGAIRINWLPLTLLIANTLVLPAAVILLMYHPWISIAFVLARVLLQGLFLVQILDRIGLAFRWVDYLVYQSLALLGGLFVAIYCLWPGGVYWKGRKYSFW